MVGDYFVGIVVEISPPVFSSTSTLNLTSFAPTSNHASTHTPTFISTPASTPISTHTFTPNCILISAYFYSLPVRSIRSGLDFGNYSCVAENSLGTFK